MSANPTVAITVDHYAVPKEEEVYESEGWLWWMFRMGFNATYFAARSIAVSYMTVVGKPEQANVADPNSGYLLRRRVKS